MKCDFNGEMSFPLPFSILGILISLGLFLARFLRNGNRYFITLLAMMDMLLKINWIVLCVLLWVNAHYVSAAIISYCLFATVILNLFIWRPLYKKYNLA